MTGLPYLADNIKSLLKWSAIVAVSLFGLWLTWLLISFTYRLVFPPEPEGPDLAFGKLEQPVSFNANFNGTVFTLDTPGKSLADPGDKLTVYKILTPEGEFASLDNAKKIAKGGGLDSEPFKLSEEEWRFSNQKNPNKSLKFNIVTNNFLYQYDWNADTSALEGIFKTNDGKIISQAKTALKSFKSLKEDLDSGTTKVSFYKLAGSSRNKVGSYSEANAVQIEFLRDKITPEQEFVEANPNLSNVTVLISPSQKSEKQLLEIKFNYWTYLKDQTATYSPRSAEQAFEDLKLGKAFIASGADENFTEVTITESKIAYLNPTSQQIALQPVYIFKGKGTVAGEQKEFIAFVPALKSDYLK